MNYSIIDTHSHIYFSDFDVDITDVINRALNVGITKIYLPALSISSYLSMNKLADLYPKICFKMIGLHPLYVNQDISLELKFIYNKLKQDEFIAIGEIGLDFVSTHSLYENQMKAFCYQVNLAKEVDLPIVIHSRNSLNHIFNIFKKMKIYHQKGVLHCFSGSTDEAKRIIDIGMKIGIGGILTFKNSNLSSLLRNIKIHDIVLETDSPYLAPHPFRGKRNEPCYLAYIIKKLSNIYSIPYHDICNITTQNAQSIFDK